MPEETVVEEVEGEAMIPSVIMGRDIPESESRYLDYYDDYITEDFENSSMYYCSDCSRTFLPDDFDSDRDCCYTCSERLDEDDVFDDDPDRNADVNSKKFQSKTKGKFIKSDRTFGVEVECDLGSTKNYVVLKDQIPKEYGIVYDGSVHGNKPVEIVTPILQGKKGEESLTDVLDKVNKLGTTVNNSCGLHVHLGGGDFVDDTSITVSTVKEVDKLKGKFLVDFQSEHTIISEGAIKAIIDENGYFLSVDTKKSISDSYNKLIEPLIDKMESKDLTVMVLRNGKYIVRSRIERVIDLTEYPDYTSGQTYPVYCNYFYILSPEQSEKQTEYIREQVSNNLGWLTESKKISLSSSINRLRTCKNTDYAILTPKNQKSAVHKLKVLAGFYHVFSEVIHAMLPESRRVNTYCRKFNDKFTMEQIKGAYSIDDIMKLWYKSTDIGSIKSDRVSSKYDDSRYYGINFHSLFRNGTVEIRYHSGTTNKIKILFWIVIHQTILDLVSSEKIGWSQIDKANNLIGVQKKLQYFFELLKLPTKIESYIKTRISYLNNVSKQSLSKVESKGIVPEEEGLSI